jgi:hypothetical protein
MSFQGADAYLSISKTQLRVTLRNLTGRKGLGVHGVMFGLELLPTQQAALVAGTHVLIHGQLHAGPESGGMHYLGQIYAAGPTVFSSGPVTSVDLIADLTSDQLTQIDEMRAGGGLTLTLNVYGTLLDLTAPEAFYGQLVYRVDAAHWAAVLEQCGRGSRIIGFVPNKLP